VELLVEENPAEPKNGAGRRRIGAHPRPLSNARRERNVH